MVLVVSSVYHLIQIVINLLQNSFSGQIHATSVSRLIEYFYRNFLYPNFDNKERFKQILLEQKSEMETMIIPRGHSAIMTRLKARDHEAHFINEQIGSVDGLFFIRKLINEVDNNWRNVYETLNAIHKKLIHTNSIKINITSSQNVINDIRPFLYNFVLKYLQIIFQNQI